MNDPLTVIDAMLADVDAKRAALKPVGGRGVPFDGAQIGLIIRRGVIREVRDAITGDDPSHWEPDPLGPGEHRLGDLLGWPSGS